MAEDNQTEQDDDDDLPAGVLDKGVEAEIRAAVRITDRENYERQEEERLREEDDLIKRARSLRDEGHFSFPARKYGYDPGVTGRRRDMPAICDENLMAFLDTMFGKAGKGCPFLDTFKGQIVDHNNQTIDPNYSMRAWLECASLVDFGGVSIETLRKALHEWAATYQKNSLVERLNTVIPVWDGVPRMADELSVLFKPLPDNEEDEFAGLNKRFSQYFWLSLYARLMKPGEYAPIVLSLISSQFAGKSYFATILCQEILGDMDAAPVLFDISADKKDMLRSITGRTVVASVGEMTGFRQADMGKVNAFVTNTCDPLDWKFMPHYMQQRQWIIIMDGNSYEGLQRDEAGNRRFYPMFLGQTPDKNGQPQWEEGFKVDFTGFRERLWQILAECRAWIDANGMKAYRAFVDEVAKEVYYFNKSERKRGRGTFKDEELDDALIPALNSVLKEEVNGYKYKGVLIMSLELVATLRRYNRTLKITPRTLRRKMAMLGGEDTNNVKGGRAGFLFADRDVVTFLARINGTMSDDVKVTKECGETAFPKEANINPKTGKSAFDNDEGF